MEILLLRSDGLRHRALETFLRARGLSVSSIIDSRRKIALRAEVQGSRVIDSYLRDRDFFEHDYFRDLSSGTASSGGLQVTDINDPTALEFRVSKNPEVVVTFGCGVLGKPWFAGPSHNILGIHLGLSPYYRGSGTNFFPFVTGELALLGSTLFKVDEGIDSGPIYHQLRARMNPEDSIHSVGNRLIRDTFDALIRVLESYDHIPPRAGAVHAPMSKLFRRSDFTEEAVLRAQENIQNGIIRRYLADRERLDSQFPIVEGSQVPH